MSFNDENEADETGLGFNASEIEKKIEVLPAGNYPVVIEKATLRYNEPGDIRSANLQLVVTSGEFERRKIFARHAVATTRQGRKLDSGEDSMGVMVRIGKEGLGELFRACGVGGASLAPLVGKECIVRLTVRPARDQYDESNDVKGYKPKAGQKTAPAVEGKASAKAVASKPSFMNKKASAVPQPAVDDSDEEASDD